MLLRLACLGVRNVFALLRLLPVSSRALKEFLERLAANAGV